jgi:hypothetical protein
MIEILYRIFVAFCLIIPVCTIAAAIVSMTSYHEDI